MNDLSHFADRPDYCEKHFGRKPTAREAANAALWEAERKARKAEEKFEAAKTHLAMLEVKLDRARRNVVAKAQDRDAAALDELVEAAPDLTDVQKKTVGLLG